MYEFSICNQNEINEIIFGYDYKDACKRAGLNPDEWAVITIVYID